MDVIDRQRAELDRETAATTDFDRMAVLSAEREALRRSYERLETEARGFEEECLAIDEQHSEWCSIFAAWEFRRQALVRELATCHDGPADDLIFAVERDVIRSKGQIEAELNFIRRQM